MTPALKAAVAAMEAALRQQVDAGQVNTMTAPRQFGPPTWVALEDIDVGALARAVLLTIVAPDAAMRSAYDAVACKVDGPSAALDPEALQAMIAAILGDVP